MFSVTLACMLVRSVSIAQFRCPSDWLLHSNRCHPLKIKVIIVEVVFFFEKRKRKKNIGCLPILLNSGSVWNSYWSNYTDIIQTWENKLRLKGSESWNDLNKLKKKKKQEKEISLKCVCDVRKHVVNNVKIKYFQLPLMLKKVCKLFF